MKLCQNNSTLYIEPNDIRHLQSLLYPVDEEIQKKLVDLDTEARYLKFDTPFAVEYLQSLDWIPDVWDYNMDPYRIQQAIRHMRQQRDCYTQITEDQQVQLYNSYTYGICDLRRMLKMAEQSEIYPFPRETYPISSPKKEIFFLKKLSLFKKRT